MIDCYILDAKVTKPLPARRKMSERDEFDPFHIVACDVLTEPLFLKKLTEIGRAQKNWHNWLKVNLEG